MDDKELLVFALRQYKHNDGSAGFVMGYDIEETDKVVNNLIKLINLPKSDDKITHRKIKQFRDY